MHGRSTNDILIVVRGLKAFVKYVPRTVVKMMLRGDMESTPIMRRKTLTIIFMDIAGFSTLCEKISVTDLLKVLNDYLQQMCEVIERNNGMLDKVCFIVIVHATSCHYICCWCIPHYRNTFPFLVPFLSHVLQT